MNTKKLVLTAIFIAMGVSLSFVYIPVGVAKCYPIQHMINVLCAVLLGPFYAVSAAFATSLLRVSLSTGSLLAFPGSMAGALLASAMYAKSGKRTYAYVGEILGTGLVGALIAYPVASLLMGKEVALFTFVVPFTVSTVGGTLIAVVLINAMDKSGILKKINNLLSIN